MTTTMFGYPNSHFKLISPFSSQFKIRLQVCSKRRNCLNTFPQTYSNILRKARYFRLLGAWKMGETRARVIIHQVEINEIITAPVLGYLNLILNLISPLYPQFKICISRQIFKNITLRVVFSTLQQIQYKYKYFISQFLIHDSRKKKIFICPWCLEILT